MKVQTLVKINSIDVTSYLVDYVYEKTYGDCLFEIDITVHKGIQSVLTLQTGQTIEVWRGYTTPTDVKVFSGYIETFNPSGGLINIIGKDKLWDAVRKEVTHTYDSSVVGDPAYPAGKISAIFQDLVTTYAGLNADSSTIQDSGTVIVLKQYICDHSDPFDRMKDLATTMNWQFYYRADTDKVYFEPKGYTTNPNIFQVGTNIFNVPKWTYDDQEMVNDLIINGAVVNIQTTETGQITTSTPPYQKSSIALNFEPTSVKLYHGTSSGALTNLLAGGIVSSTSSFDYSVYINKTSAIYQLLPNSTYNSGNGFIVGDWYTTQYLYNQPVPVRMYNQNSIDNYGLFKKTVTWTDITSIADAEQRGTNYLIQYSIPFIYSTLWANNTTDYSLDVGQIINVIDNINIPNINKNLQVTRLRLKYPAIYDEIVVGDKSYRQAAWQESVEDRLKRLSELQSVANQITTEIVTIDNSTINPITVSPRYRQITYQNMGGDTLIWGNPSFGIWGNFKWGNIVNNGGFILGLAVLGTSTLGTNASLETDWFIQQYQNIYTETFIDTDFLDANSTADWSTDGSCNFTNGEIALSSSVDYNNGVITTAKLTADSSTNLVFQVTADNINWETVTSGVIHTFTDTGTDLRWKATASGNATLTNLVLSNYH